MFKNTAGQKFVVFAFDSTTMLPKSGDAANIAAYIAKDYAASATVLADTSATEIDATNAKGYYLFDAAQAESNADAILLTGKSSTANIVVIGSPAMLFPQGVPALKRGQALANFHFEMTDSTTHAPATGKTVTVTRALDSGAQAAGTLSAVTEVANGMYRVDFATGDTTATVMTLRCTATGCDDLLVTFLIDQ